MGEEEKNSEEKKKPAPEDSKEEAPATEESKDVKEITKAEHLPPPPPTTTTTTTKEIVLKVYMHCEGCARKIRRCLKGFEGVEDVMTDCKGSKVVVKGEKADPLRVLERIERKSHRRVVLLSPLPKPAADGLKLPEEKDVVKMMQEKKVEPPPVITVTLGVYMHCEACAQEIKKRIQRMKGVESAEPDLKNSQVRVKGVFEPEKLVDYVQKRAGKHAVVVKVESEKKVEELEAKMKVEKEAKKGEDHSGKESKDSPSVLEPAQPPPVKVKPAAAETAEEAAEEEEWKLDMRRNESSYYYPQNQYEVNPPRYVQDMLAYPPQMFSDENPNACSVM